MIGFSCHLTTIISYLRYIACNWKVVVNDELRRIWKDATVAYFNLIFRYFFYEIKGMPQSAEPASESRNTFHVRYSDV
jgi:hypothetical protein